MCKMCLKTNILGLGLSSTMYSALQSCQKKTFICVFSHKYRNISVRVTVRTCSLPTSYKSSNCLKHNQTAFQRNVSVSERLSGQRGVGSAQDPIRAAPRVVSAGCTRAPPVQLLAATQRQLGAWTLCSVQQKLAA